jgi:23S rRNA C2498 (ribose-2'-O)-methylase RlmM
MTKKITQWVSDDFIRYADVKHPVSWIMCEMLNPQSVLSTDAKWLIISPQNIEQNDIDLPIEFLSHLTLKCSMDKTWYFECIY